MAGEFFPRWLLAFLHRGRVLLARFEIDECQSRDVREPEQRGVLRTRGALDDARAARTFLAILFGLWRDTAGMCVARSEIFGDRRRDQEHLSRSRPDAGDARTDR